MEILQAKTADLIPYGFNNRDHSQQQIDRIANSINEFGFNQPIVVDEQNIVLVGHGRLEAAKKLGLEDVPVLKKIGLSETQKKAYRILDNKLQNDSTWNTESLEIELAALEEADFDFGAFGLDEFAKLFSEEKTAKEDDFEPREVKETIVKLNDILELGDHRLMCGDSTKAEDVAHLMNGEKALLLHADPPYGMGKVSDGVLNDNIYGSALDEFQMAWWKTFRTHLCENASAYIWGNAPDLWRLWYAGGLGDSETIELRNELVWDKKCIPGMASPELTQYPIASERCLFFQLGKQFRGNINSDDFPDEWEEIRGYLQGEADAANVGPNEIKQICGVQMYSHWFTRSQFTLIPQHHYQALAKAFPERFNQPWQQIKKAWDAVKSGPTSVIQQSRSFFDNSHEVMRDVWEFPRVVGVERHGHATPKPVQMMGRIIKSSSRMGGIVVEPFLGSGTTLIAADQLGRKCYGMEISPTYCQVIVDRYKAHCEKAGKPFVCKLNGEDVSAYISTTDQLADADKVIGT